VINYWSHIMHLSNNSEKYEYCEAVHQLFIDFKKSYDSFRMEGFNILGVCVITMKLVRSKNMSN
jgi:hypothetical protein